MFGQNFSEDNLKSTNKVWTVNMPTPTLDFNLLISDHYGLFSK